jgi:hypothetical protein
MQWAWRLHAAPEKTESVPPNSEKAAAVQRPALFLREAVSRTRMCVFLSLKIILAAFTHTYISVSMTVNYGDSNTQILFPLSLLRPFQGNFPSPWTCVTFR